MGKRKEKVYIWDNLKKLADEAHYPCEIKWVSEYHEGDESVAYVYIDFSDHECGMCENREKYFVERNNLHIHERVLNLTVFRYFASSYCN